MFTRDDVQWNEEQEVMARKMVAANSEVKLSHEEIEKYETNANKYWDSFYGIHTNRFFKDRHWLFTEFPELNFDASSSNENNIQCTRAIFEVGCGVGNTIFPILQYSKNCNIFVYGCDFSQQAVDILRANSDYDSEKCHAFVLDVTSEDWNVPFEENSLDIVVLIFVLSAIKPEKYVACLKLTE